MVEGDIKKARVKAVRDYMMTYLQYTEDELRKVVIEDTKVSTKGDKTVYVAFRDIETIKDIHWRVLEIKNPEIGIMNYIPPQFWQCYMFLNRDCAEYRRVNPDIKTQLRFGKVDIEVLMKTKGSPEHYINVTFNTFTNPAEVPTFDFSLKWTQRKEREPRGKLVSIEGMDRQKEIPVGRMDVEENPNNLCDMLRKILMDITRTEMKRQKLSVESSSSGPVDETENYIYSTNYIQPSIIVICIVYSFKPLIHNV